jgi:hypothetical protein
MNYKTSTKEYFLGLYVVYTILFTYNGTSYELVFTRENRDKFEHYLKK